MLGLALMPAWVAPSEASEQLPVLRLAGDGRHGTAAAISKHAFPGQAAEVFIVSDNGWSDALAGGVAAGYRRAPLLPVARDRMPTVVAQEVDRLQPNVAWVIGGRGAVDDSVIVELAARGVTVRRISGADRYATSAAVVQECFELHDGAGAYYASGATFADSLGGSSRSRRSGVAADPDAFR